MYDLAKQLNKHRWRLEQQLFCSGYDASVEISRVLLELVPRLRVLFDEPTVLKLEEYIEQAKLTFLDVLYSESFGESFSEEIDEYRRRAKGLPWDEEYFDPTRGLSRGLIEKITEAIRAELAGEASLNLALDLGVLVDRGLRPLDVAASTFVQVPNPDHWRDKRSDEYRRDIARRRKEFGEFKKNFAGLYPDEDDPEPASCPLDRKMKILAKERLRAIPCEACSADIQPKWVLAVRALWVKLELPTKLPAALFEVYRRRDARVLSSLTHRIDDAVLAGFHRLHEASEGRSNDSLAKGLTEVRMSSISVIGPAATPSADVDERAIENVAVTDSGRELSENLRLLADLHQPGDSSKSFFS